jgi:hypothetical protein
MLSPAPRQHGASRAHLVSAGGLTQSLAPLLGALVPETPPIRRARPGRSPHVGLVPPPPSLRTRTPSRTPSRMQTPAAHSCAIASPSVSPLGRCAWGLATPSCRGNGMSNCGAGSAALNRPPRGCQPDSPDWQAVGSGAVRMRSFMMVRPLEASGVASWRESAAWHPATSDAAWRAGEVFCNVHSAFVNGADG